MNKEKKLNQENTQEETTLRRINQRLRDFFLPSTKLTPHEEIIMNIIFKIFNAMGTIIVESKTYNSTYIINRPLHYFVKISSNRVWIINTVDAIVKDCSTTFIAYLNKIIREHIDNEAKLIDDTIFNNEQVLQQKIEDNLCKNTDN